MPWGIPDHCKWRSKTTIDPLPDLKEYYAGLGMWAYGGMWAAYGGTWAAYGGMWVAYVWIWAAYGGM